MSVFDTIRIAASGLTAERLRMDVAASNLANAQTTRTQNGPAGTPYEAEAVVFQAQQMGPMAAAQGVSAVAIVKPPSPNVRVYDPTNPDADTPLSTPSPLPPEPSIQTLILKALAVRGGEPRGAGHGAGRVDRCGAHHPGVPAPARAALV